MNRQVGVEAQLTEVASLLVPLGVRHLALPNVSVAEVVSWREPEPLPQAPAWLLGRIAWRDQMVPLVSFELLNDEAAVEAPAQRRIVILNNVTGDPNLPFCALACTGVPRLTRVVRDELVEDPGTAPGPMEVCRVLVAGERAAIPDLELLQRSVLAVL